VAVREELGAGEEGELEAAFCSSPPDVVQEVSSIAAATTAHLVSKAVGLMQVMSGVPRFPADPGHTNSTNSWSVARFTAVGISYSREPA
jgi:hypothetical protein